MNTDILALTISVLSLLLTTIGTYIAYKQYIAKVRGKPKEITCKNSKSNRHVCQLSVAFTIKVTKD